MTRSPRIKYPGARYHVLSRGNRREYILGADPDNEFFRETLTDCCKLTEQVEKEQQRLLRGVHW